MSELRIMAASPKIATVCVCMCVMFNKKTPRKMATGATSKFLANSYKFKFNFWDR